MVRVTKQDGLDIGFCARGQARFFRAHGLDFKAFWDNGIDHEAVAGIDDMNMNKVIAAALKREKESARGK